MVPSPAETLSTSLNESWTFVSRRRHRHRGKVSPNNSSGFITRHPSSVGGTPCAWAPVDSSTDPERESKLLCRMESSIRRLDNSRFVRRFLSRLRDPQIQGGLHELMASCSQIQIVAYGIGSIESYEVPRLQVALALKLKEELGVRNAGLIEVFDPVLSAVECAVLASLGCRVISENEYGRREASIPTLFYMPHCEAALYDNLLDANWKPAMLRRMVVLGNSFGVYDHYVCEMKGTKGSVALEVDLKHLLSVRRYVREVEMEEWANDRVLKGCEEVEFYKAFHDMSWHFFELDDNTDMNSLCKRI